MNPRITFATGARVLTQLRRDHRTVVMLLVLPSVILGLMCWIYSDIPGRFDQIGPRMLGLMPFVVMFIVTSVATLRERRTGTLERLLTTPMNKLDLLLGYGFAFGLVAIVQAGIATGLTMTWYGVDAETRGGWAMFLTASTVAVFGAAAGLFASAFARTEFQAVQLMPAFVLPQFLLCGLLVPREQLNSTLNAISDFLPLSYAVDAMAESVERGGLTGQIGRDLAIIGGSAFLALAAGAATLSRQSA
ncbi:ABC transporter permease [Sporichthya sp.]|uniref:ABC transporter permease n=1 Tax=Sporichthya sp. TaxID=65475 RepID=UPI0018163653|nr:ABC transporter permease [Sporichthya sp.]MBA3742152.1 ABC transporter permease [Sporichthya sp.]